MKWEGAQVGDFIVLGVFVDDFASMPTSQKLVDSDEAERLYSVEDCTRPSLRASEIRGFEYTGGNLTTFSLGLDPEAEQLGRWNHCTCCKLH
jgi:hypothetical protein